MPAWATVGTAKATTNAVAPPQMARASLVSRTAGGPSILRTAPRVAEIGLVAAFAIASEVRHVLRPSVYPIQGGGTQGKREYPKETIHGKGTCQGWRTELLGRYTWDRKGKEQGVGLHASALDALGKPAQQTTRIDQPGRMSQSMQAAGPHRSHGEGKPSTPFKVLTPVADCAN